MGNCCGGVADDEPPTSKYTSGGAKKQQAFQGQGHRLGSADEPRAQEANAMARQQEEDLIPEPIHNPNLTVADRENQRADRLAAVEARMKSKQPKKPKKSSGEPLRGPNSKPTMTWSMGN